MIVAVILASVFLISPVLAYVVLASDLSIRTKVRLGVAGVVVLTVLPFAMLIFGGE